MTVSLGELKPTTLSPLVELEPIVEARGLARRTTPARWRSAHFVT